MSNDEVGPSLSRAPLAWKAVWSSVLVIRNLPLVGGGGAPPPPPPVLRLMWFPRVISYLSLVPNPCFVRNNRSAELHPSSFEEVIIKLSAADCIEEHLEPPYCVNPLSEAEGKKLRLVIDVRHVNQYRLRLSFKYEVYIVFPNFPSRTFGHPTS